MSFNLPIKPLFIAQYSSQITNATGNGTAVTFPFNSTLLNVGSCFSSNTFTAPKAGFYIFNGFVTVSIGTGIGMTSGSVALNVNAVAKFFNFLNPLAIKDVNNNLQFSIPPQVIQLSSGDAVTLTVTVSGGSQTAAVGNNDVRASTWAGMMLN